jgi:hypothetical protein
MEAEVREALRHLITAFENHLEAVTSRRSPDDAAVDDAYEALAAAFERYEEKLDLEFAEGLPLVLDDADDDESDGVVAVDALGDDAEEDEIDDDLDEFNLRD